MTLARRVHRIFEQLEHFKVTLINNFVDGFTSKMSCTALLFNLIIKTISENLPVGQPHYYASSLDRPPSFYFPLNQ